MAPARRYSCSTWIGRPGRAGRVATRRGRGWSEVISSRLSTTSCGARGRVSRSATARTCAANAASRGVRGWSQTCDRQGFRRSAGRRRADRLGRDRRHDPVADSCRASSAQSHWLSERRPARAIPGPPTRCRATSEKVRGRPDRGRSSRAARPPRDSDRARSAHRSGRPLTCCAIRPDGTPSAASRTIRGDGPAHRDGRPPSQGCNLLVTRPSTPPREDCAAPTSRHPPPRDQVTIRLPMPLSSTGEQHFQGTRAERAWTKTHQPASPASTPADQLVIDHRDPAAATSLQLAGWLDKVATRGSAAREVADLDPAEDDVPQSDNADSRHPLTYA